MENREVSSANSLHLLLRPSDKSLICIKNNKGPRINPWLTPVQKSALEEQWPFKTTVCFLLRRIYRKILMISPRIPFWRSLKIRLSWHTLSKAFEISRSNPQTSSPLSNALINRKELIDARVTWSRSWLAWIKKVMVIVMMMINCFRQMVNWQKAFMPYFQSGPLLEFLTITNLRYAACKVWSCAELQEW